MKKDVIFWMMFQRKNQTVSETETLTMRKDDREKGQQAWREKKERRG